LLVKGTLESNNGELMCSVFYRRFCFIPRTVRSVGCKIISSWWWFI